VDVFLANEQDRRIDEERLTALTRHTLVSEEVDDDAEISVLFVTPGHMRQLNARYAGADYATDVLAFPMMEDEEEEEALLLGDVVVCPDVAERNAATVGHDLERELETLVVHGTLHLLGYDHQGPADRARMERRLKEILESFQWTKSSL
jgi:probable rRNA maturation factor